MSLEALFEDRLSRKFIRDHVNEGTDSGQGTCSVCGEKSYLIHAFNRDICESCGQRLLEVAEDYDTVLSGISEENVISLIREGYFVPDMAKVQTDANAKFGGDIPKLLASYGMKSPKDWDDRLKDGYLWAEPSDIKSGKTSLNKFLNDYNCQPAPRMAKGWVGLVADADGTIWANNPNTGVPAPGPAQPKASFNSPSVTASSSTSVGYVTGSLQSKKFEIQVGDKAELYVQVTSQAGQPSVYSVGYSDGIGSAAMVVKASKEITDIKDAVELIKSEVAKNPQMLFPSFDGTRDGIFEISKYDIYKFKFDEKSFGSQFSMAVMYNGKVGNRVVLPQRALNSKTVLSSALTQYMDDIISKKAPAYVSNPKFKTSIGVATFDLEKIEGDPSAGGNFIFRISLGNEQFAGRVAADRFKNPNDAKDAYAEMILNSWVQSKNNTIPGFNDPSIVRKGKSMEYEFEVVYGQGTNNHITIGAIFDDQIFYDKGDIVFNMSIIDDYTGEEQPKKLRQIIYRKARVNLKDFLLKAAQSIYDEFFGKTTMVNSMKPSAVAKMKVPSKKTALMTKIADKLIKELREPKIMDLEVELDMQVNKDGKVIKASVIITDPYNDVSNNVNELDHFLQLEKTHKWLGPAVANSKSKEPSLIYPIKDIEAFAEVVDLHLFENAIFEAFGIVRITESGRKQLYI